MKLSPKIKELLKNAARKLTGSARRAFEAKTTRELFEGNARKAERELGWYRHTVKKGLKELSTGIQCLDNYQSRFVHCSEKNDLIWKKI